MTKTYRTVTILLVSGLVMAAASPGGHRAQPDITSPFGSQVTTVSWLQSPIPDPNLVPPWSPIVNCGQIPGPNLLYADDPEKWDYTDGKSWTYTNPNQPQVTVNNLLLMQGGLDPTTPGLIFFYFDNELGVTARLYIGGRSNQSISTTFNYMVSEDDAAAPNARSFNTHGAMETASFLSNFVPGTGYSGGTVYLNTSALPTPITTYTVSTGHVIQGEMSVTNLSGNATFYVYADDCSPTPCPSLQNVNLKGDNHQRRGNFASAAYVLDHDYTPSIESGGFSWYDVVSSSSCVGQIAGIDPFGFYTPRNSGDYGVPVTITGTAARAQFWYVAGSPAGEGIGTQFGFAAYDQGMTDPATGVDVTGGWAFAFPATNPPTPSPQPTATPLVCCDQSAVLGKDPDSTTRTITWIPSGGEVLPARFWYNIGVGVDSARSRRERNHRP